MQQVLKRRAVLSSRRGVLLFLLVLAGCGGQQAVEPVGVAAANQVSVQQPAAAVSSDRQAVAYAAQTGVGDALALQDRLIQLYGQANPSVVYIIAEPLGSGSGFVYDGEGHIVTNDHVIEGARSLEVVFAGGERRSAHVGRG